MKHFLWLPDVSLPQELSLLIWGACAKLNEYLVSQNTKSTSLRNASSEDKGQVCLLYPGPVMLLCF